MTLHLIGLGLNEKSITAEALEKVRSCKKVYLEGYTVTFPYSEEELRSTLEVNFEILRRETVENESIIQEAKEQEIALLIYGDPLSATTHTQLQKACKEQNIKCNVYHNASIITAIGETGLSLYKFGKTASLPNWKEHTNKPTSFLDYIEENKRTGAHTLLLSDIGLTYKEAISQIEESTKKEEKTITYIIATSSIGTKKQKIVQGTLGEIKKEELEEPLCFIIPGTLSHTEKEYLGTMHKN